MADTKAPDAPEAPDEPDRKTLEKMLSDLEHENKSLLAQLAMSSPEAVEELKAKNKELKSQLLQVEKDLAKELTERKLPIDANGISDKFQIFKTEVLTYCAERKIDPPLWKKLESL